MEFLQPSFWLTLQPPIVTEGIGRAFFLVFAAMLIGGIIVRFRAQRLKKTDRLAMKVTASVGTLLTTMGALGIGLSFFGYQRIQFLGARFWYPVWVIIALVWAYYVWRYAKKTVPTVRAEREARAEREKYLPKKN